MRHVQASFHYFDSRGVTRLFRMTLGDGAWTLLREDPDFYQRFSGTRPVRQVRAVR